MPDYHLITRLVGVLILPPADKVSALVGEHVSDADMWWEVLIDGDEVHLELYYRNSKGVPIPVVTGIVEIDPWRSDSKLNSLVSSVRAKLEDWISEAAALRLKIGGVRVKLGQIKFGEEPE